MQKCPQCIVWDSGIRLLIVDQGNRYAVFRTSPSQLMLSTFNAGTEGKA